MHIGQGLLEPEGAEDGTQGLTGLGWIDGQGLALEVEFLILRGRAPLEDLLDLLGGVPLFHAVALPGEVIHILRFPEEGIAGLDLVDGLAHG
jgi:hypothetical protein